MLEWILVAGLFIAASGESSASACTDLRSPGRVVSGSIGLVYDDDVPPGVISRAIDAWSQCSNYSADFPKLLDGRPGDQVLQIVWDSGNSGTDRCGTILGRTVTLYRFARDSKGRNVPCGDRGLNLAHEIGHALGLRDSPRTLACDGGLMARLSEANRFDRRVTKEECSLAGQRWLTFAEVDRDDDGIIHERPRRSMLELEAAQATTEQPDP